MAKAIISAGLPLPDARMAAGGPAPAKRQIDDGEEPEEDLFGAEPDMFGEAEEPDMFGGEPEPEPEPPPVEEKTPPPPKKEKKEAKKPEPVTESAAPATFKATFRGFDPRVCRLVEASYPAEYDKNMRSTNSGHPDLTIIEPIGGRRGVLVDQVRQLQSIADLPPIEGMFRVVIIIGADTITQEGGNSILKLLEEPPGYLVMILVANQESSVLPTIRSRCSVVPMNPVPREELVEKLIDEERLEPELAKVAAALSEGRPGVALNVVAQSLLERRRSVFEARLQIDRFGKVAVPSTAERVDAAGGSLEESLWLLISFARDRLVRACAPNEPRLLVHGDAIDLLDVASPENLLLDAEAQRLVDAYRMLEHPFLPNRRAALQTILWPDNN